MIIYGASGHGKVISSIVNGEELLYFDDNELLETFLNKPVALYDENRGKDEELVIAIGNNQLRKEVASKVSHIVMSVIHPSAQIAETVVMGVGNQIVHSATIQTHVKIGNHCIINTAAAIDHDCILEDFCHIAPNSTLCGNVKIGEGTLIGAGAVVTPGVKIGKWCTIGAGSVVTKNIPDNTTVVGNPAREIKKK